jgi:transposase
MARRAGASAAAAGGRIVLSMVDVEFIRKKHLVEGWSIRKISRQLEVARQTVRKALVSAELPRYRLTKPRPSPVMDPYRAVITQWLTADASAPPKQRHTAKRVYDRLVAEYGFTGAEPSVRRCVAHLRPRPHEAFVPLTAGWGQQAQVDWGQATVRIAGAPVVAHLFCVRLRASQVPFVWAAPTEKLEAFLEGHGRAFAWLGGVPAECVYDNPKTAVVRILAGPAREEHRHFASLRAHYLFDSLFCRPAQGHEKGAVENLVGYVRRNALVPVPDLPSWDALNAQLLAWCEGERTRLASAWTLEQAGLRSLPVQPFAAALTRLVPVSRLSWIRVDLNRYSVPCAYVGQTVRVALTTHTITVWAGADPIAIHERRHGRGETVLVLEHYLPVLARKPRAVSHAAVIAQLPPIYQAVRDQLCHGRLDGYRDFAAILLLHREFPAPVLEVALEEAHRRGCLGATAVRQLALNHTAPGRPPLVAVPPALQRLTVAPPDLAQYNTLLTEVGA